MKQKEKECFRILKILENYGFLRQFKLNHCRRFFIKSTLLISSKKSFQSCFNDSNLLRKYRKQIIQSNVSCDNTLDPKTDMGNCFVLRAASRSWKLAEGRTEDWRVGREPHWLSISGRGSVLRILYWPYTARGHGGLQKKKKGHHSLITELFELRDVRKPRFDCTWKLLQVLAGRTKYSAGP